MPTRCPGTLGQVLTSNGPTTPATFQDPTGEGGGPHSHPISGVTGLQAALDGKAASNHNHDANYAGLSHAHIISNVTGLQSALDGKAAASHAHATSDVTGLDNALAAKAPLASPTLTGTPTAPTAAPGTNTTQVSTTAFVAAAIAAIPPSGGPQTCKKSADQTFSSATPANVTGMSFPVVSGRYYHFRFVVLFQSNTATVGIGISVTHPGATRFGATVESMIAADGAGGVLQGAVTASDDAVLGTAVAVINTDYLATVEGVFLASANGTLQLRARTETGTTPVIVRQGSVGFLTDMGN